MNKTLYTAILTFLTQSVIAQKGIDNLIKAEKGFAAYSVAHNTKEAFLQFIDSNSIMFDEGKPVTAIEFWNRREKRPGILNWHPQYSEISASGDFGYTTGPWTYQNSPNDSVIARGQYATVWRLNNNGEWKFVVDFGIDNTQPGSDEERIVNISKVSGITIYKPHVHPLISTENKFNELLQKNKRKAYKACLSSKSMLLRNGFLPAVDLPGQKAIIDSTPSKISYQMNGWGISNVEDIGYTYGTAMIKDKPHNYFRIWRREINGWKIAVEVMRY